MGVGSGRSQVGDLSFAVYGRVIHPDWFAVRAHQRHVQPAWEADVRIVAGGHAISWSCGRIRLAEVLVGPETLLPETGLLYQSAVRQERSTALRPGDRVEYNTCFSVERIDAEVFRHLSEELVLDARRGGLFHREAPSNRMLPAPVSRVHIDVRPRGLSVQSFHTFPDERAIVRTQSLFEFRPPLPT